MPVVECTCGMIMSAAADASRDVCIRCGRRKLNRFDGFRRSAASKSWDDSPGWLRTALKRTQPSPNVRSGAIVYRSASASGELTRDGSHI